MNPSCKHLILSTAALAAFVLGATSLPARAEDAKQLITLPAATKPRFEIKPQDWPAKVGDASICLWQDDKTAAACITIDDNTVPDHAWWLEQSKKYDFKFTWFVITKRVGTGSAYFGVWDDFKKLRDAGQDVESHSADHFGSINGAAVLEADENYSQSIPDLEKNLPGLKVKTLAYPGGTNPDKNDHAAAAKYFIAARGTAGMFNQANKIDYNNTNSVGGAASLDAGHKWAGLPNTITLNPAQKLIYRAWVCMHFHSLANDQYPKAKAGQDKKTEAAAMLAYLHEHVNDFWVGTFTEIAEYGQERDSATLTHAVVDKSVKLNITDTMDDKLYDYPLTVKVRIDPAWTTASASQGSKDVPVKIIDHDGGKFALVGVIPDRGDVMLTGQAGPAGDKK